MQHKKKNTIALIELSVVFIIWLIIFLSPVIIQFGPGTIEWETIFSNWSRLAPFLILSLFNHFILFPFVFINKKKIWYLTGSVITLVVFSFILKEIQHPPRNPYPQHHEDAVDLHRPPINHNVPGWRPGGRLEDRPPVPSSPGGLPPYLNSAIIALLILGFDTGMRSAFRWTKTEREKETLEKEKIQSELAFLRNQVNPHFLMNTLNNIHALVDLDTEMAKDTVIRLSKLMRYLLYDTERESIAIKEELSFISSYVELMIMRISKHVKVTLDIKAIDQEKKIPPLLFTSLIENAFKHGISNKIDTFIDISFETTNDELNFKVSNTIVRKEKENSLYSGIGIENARKRLDILYGSDYVFDINAANNIYSVELKIPL